MSIMPPYRENPLGNCRLIASAVLRALDEKAPEGNSRHMAYNSLFRLGTAMDSHRFYGMRNADYAKLADILDACISKATDLPSEQRWKRLLEALRCVDAGNGSDEDQLLIRTMSQAMTQKLEYA